MTKDTRKMSDEEYQFPQEEYVSAEQPSHEQEPEAAHDNEADETYFQPKRSGIFGILSAIPFLRNKRVLLVIGVGVIALIGFKIFTSGHKAKVISQKPASAPTQTVEQPNPQMMSQLSSLKQNQSQNQNDINQLQQQMQSLHDDVSQATSSQNQMQQDMSMLVTQVKTLTDEVKKLNAENKAKKNPGPRLVYHLKAILPGRAWIVDNFGHAETVAVGDKVKDYGRVKSIDPVNGVLMTSSGKVIVYGTYDS